MTLALLLVWFAASDSLVLRFTEATAMASTPDGTIYVADAGARNLVIWDFGKDPVVHRLGLRPTDVEPTNGLVIGVADAGAERVRLLDRRLVETGALRMPRAEPVRISSNRYGEWFVWDAAAERVRKFNPNGEPASAFPDRLPELDAPVVDILARGDRLFVLAEAPERGAVLHIYDRFGAYRGFRAAGRDARALTWVVDGPAVVGAEGIRLFDADLRNAGIDTHRRPDLIDAEFTRGIWFLLTPGGLIRHE